MEKSLTAKEQRQVLWRLLSYLKNEQRTVVFAFLLLITATTLELVGPYLVKGFIDDYLIPRRLAIRPLTVIVTIYIGTTMIKAVVTYFQLVKFQEIALRVIQQLRIDVFTKMHALSMRYFDKTPGGSIVSRVTNDTEAIKEMFVEVLASFVQNGVFVCGIFVAMFLLDAKLALYCLFLLPVIWWLIQTYRHYSSIFYKDMRERLSELNAKLNESLQGMAIIQVFRQEERLRKEFAKINDLHYRAGVKNIKLDGLLLRPAVDVVYVVAIMVVLSFFGVSALESPVKVGVLYAFVNYLERLFEPINQMMMRLSFYQQAIISGSRLFAFLDLTELAPKAEASSAAISKGKIEFRHVSFSYDGKQDVLKNISFTVQPGETVALVGHTGSGKSSIVNLLMRFYEFDRGDILIDGISLRDYSNEELRKNIGLVLQDPFLFYGTIRDNIRMYKQLSDEKIVEAARLVQAHEMIEKLPKQYDHLVVERGSAFSSGQRQLIAFARTLASNPKILVLDEATAHIDTETEEAIQQALSNMRKGRTTIAIAHRLSTIQDANQILVLHRGEIVERGTHQQLLAQRGLYYNMYMLQNGSIDVENCV